MTRPHPDRWQAPAAASYPCPCGRGKAFSECCDVPGELPLLAVDAIGPPPPVTEFAHPRCYMRATGDCSRKISGEHYVSAAILAEFGELRTAGLPWFGPGETRVGINSLRSNILCIRHNSALAPLDKEGWRSLVAIRDGLNHTLRKSLSRKSLFRIVSGDALELWGLKTLMGLLEANIVRTEGKSTAREYQVDEGLIVTALTGGGLPDGFGLYVGQDSDIIHDTIGFAPLTHTEAGRVAGLRVSFLGIVLDFLLDVGAADQIIVTRDPHFRPAILDLEGPERTARLILTWRSQRREAHRLAMQMRRITISTAEAVEVRARFARRDFERVKP